MHLDVVQISRCGAYWTAAATGILLRVNVCTVGKAEELRSKDVYGARLQ
jgi:hypothetical protein